MCPFSLLGWHPGQLSSAPGHFLTRDRTASGGRGGPQCAADVRAEAQQVGELLVTNLICKGFILVSSEDITKILFFLKNYPFLLSFHIYHEVVNSILLSISTSPFYLFLTSSYSDFLFVRFFSFFLITLLKGCLFL